MIPVRVSARLSETTGRFGREPDNIVHTMFMKSVVAWRLLFVRSEPGAPAVRSCRRLGLARCECKAYPAASGDREHVLEFMEDSTMAVTKQASKRKRRKEVVPALGVVGVSLSLASGASAATAGSVTDMPSKDTATGPGFALTEEEISDVSLGTFYRFRQGGRQARRRSVNKWPEAAAEVAAAAEAAEAAEAAQRLRRLRRRLRRLRLLLVVGILPHLLTRRLRLRCRTVSSWPGSIRFDPAIMRWLQRCHDALCLPMPAGRMVIDPASADVSDKIIRSSA